MAVDASDLDALSSDFEKVPALMVPKLRGVVAKSALNTKNIMRKDARRSKHFKQIAPTIDYDLKVFSFAGDGVIESDIGPNSTRFPAASLAGIAYYGTSRPGGGTIRDPADALLEEAPNFYEWAFKATEGLL